ncbi:hypothetical protein L9F63_010950 [Diploptera punctata]|uniref:cAMP-dependent protein kinase n=1 Tax=Diploptera punctata TaxID=6984 RepID=A0AAD8EQ77_DIPPU|nr:hypothetical protein L9F63_010950 [Diploptera punctata]
MDAQITRHFADFDDFLNTSKREFMKKWTSKFNANAKPSDFQSIKTLGTGSFGRVMLVTHIKSRKPYAMKIMEKEHIVRMKQVQHTHNEIRILDAINFQFIVRLDYYFKDNVYIYMVLPFINGGEMFTHLRNMKKFDEQLSKFYAAQVTLALEYLHFMGLIYRDLKPENILIDKDGFLKVTDLGFCKKIDDERTYTLCGTPEYLAPEVILSQGYSFSVDWWALGVLMYEMTAGYPPFYAKDPMRIYEKIVSGRFSCPAGFSKPLKDLLNHMLQVDRSKRFGVLVGGTKNIKSHTWFKAFDWEGLLMRKTRHHLYLKCQVETTLQILMHMKKKF